MRNNRLNKLRFDKEKQVIDKNGDYWVKVIDPT